MVFRNPTEHVLRFKVATLAFEVPPGGECDIPPNLSYVVASRGLPLVEGSKGGAKVEATVTKPAPMRLLEGVDVGGDPEEEVEPVEQVDATAEKLRSVLPKNKRR